MHWATAKLIALDRVEGLLARDWAQFSRVTFAHKARSLRRELPVHIVAAYDKIKARHKEPVVGVFQKKCGGCQTVLSPAALAELIMEREVNRCEQCGRFIYLAGGRGLAAHAHLPGAKTEIAS